MRGQRRRGTLPAPGEWGGLQGGAWQGWGHVTPASSPNEGWRPQTHLGQRPQSRESWCLWGAPWPSYPGSGHRAPRSLSLSHRGQGSASLLTEPWSSLQTRLSHCNNITLSTKVRLVKAMVFPVVMYGCESWTVKKVERKELMLLNCGVGEDS